MKETDFVELDIDVKQLADDLYHTQIATKTNVDPELKLRLAKCEEDLKKNIAEERIDKFLSGLETVFNENDSMQPRMLFVQFIKETLSGDELTKFKTLLTKASSDVLWPDVQYAMLEELK
ncbi:MAG: hypothetical protein HGA36_00385 [Candidatus Moranbacteria bacterium]|nr:hypothetical protein [Candidatus Moranbacteria bacterium]